ncbi:MAG: hypothetical protein KGZ97_00060 [Bacteroidetes bacterium]|nr:hypothetical protein [Bacteroidota bacterium]
MKDYYPHWTWNPSNRTYTLNNLSFQYLADNAINITFTNEDKRTFTKKVEPVIPLKNLLRLSPEKWKEDYDKAMEELKVEQTRINAMAETFRAFSLNQLGTFNFDALMKMDDWFHVKPKFVVENIIKNNNEIVIIFGDNSGYIRVKQDQINDFRINPESGHRILLMLKDNEIGIFPIESFKDMDIENLRNSTSPDVSFTFEKHVVSDAVSLREKLGF